MTSAATRAQRSALSAQASSLSCQRGFEPTYKTLSQLIALLFHLSGILNWGPVLLVGDLAGGQTAAAGSRTLGTHINDHALSP
jgi:hypothetical protein